MAQISRINKFVKNIRSAGIGTTDSTLINLGEPRSVKLTRTPPQDIHTDFRTTDSDLMASYVNITRDETSMTFHKSLDPTVGKSRENSIDSEGNDEYLINVCAREKRQADVMLSIAKHYNLYEGESFAAETYKTLPETDVINLFRRSWFQISKQFPQLEDCITNPEDNDWFP